MQVDTQSGESTLDVRLAVPEVTRLKRRRGPRIDAVRVRSIVEIAINNLQGERVKPSSVIAWLIASCRSDHRHDDQIIVGALTRVGVLLDEAWIDSDAKTLHVRDRDDDFTLTLTPASLKRPLRDVKEKLAEGGSYLSLWKARQ